MSSDSSRSAVPRWALVATASLVLATAGAIAAAAAGRSSASPLRVTLSEWAIKADRTRVTAGELELTTVNAGRMEHELVIVRTDLAADRIPVGLHGPDVRRAGRVVFGTAHVHREKAGYGAASVRGTPRHIPPGDSRRARLTLAPGRYVMLCQIGTHYLSGQRAALEVVASG